MKKRESAFARKLVLAGRSLETESYHLWCNCPSEEEDGKTHLYITNENTGASVYLVE